MKNLTKSGHRCFAANVLSYLGTFKVNDSWCKLVPFSLKEFLEVFGSQKSRDLICIYHSAKFDKICKPVSLKKFKVNVIKALEDRPPPNLFVQ